MQVNNVSKQTNFGTTYYKAGNAWREIGNADASIPVKFVQQEFEHSGLNSMGAVLVLKTRAALNLLGNWAEKTVGDVLVALTGNEAAAFRNAGNSSEKQLNVLNSLLRGRLNLSETTIIPMKPHDFSPRII